MAYDTVLENIQLMKPHTRDNGLRERNQEKVRLSSKVEVFSKAHLLTTSKRVMERCTTTLLEITLKGNGKTTKSKAKGQ